MNSIFKTGRSLLNKRQWYLLFILVIKTNFIHNLDTFDVKQNYRIFKKNLRKIN